MERAAPFLLGLVLLSGCAQPPPARPLATDVPLTPAEALSDEATCAVRGLLVDDEERPMANGSVSIVGAEMRTTKSALDGAFSFSFVQPSPYRALAEMPGYETLVQSFLCVAGGTANLTLQVDPLPQPRMVVMAPQKGRIGCAAGVPGVAGGGSDACDQFNLDANAKSRIRFGIENASVTAAVYEVEWVPGAGAFAGHVLTMIYPGIRDGTERNVTTPNSHAPSRRAVTGPSPLHVEIVSRNLTRSLYRMEDWTNVTLEVRAGADNASQFVANPLDPGSLGLVYQQEFTAYAAFFYEGMAVPAGFTMRPT